MVDRAESPLVRISVEVNSSVVQLLDQQSGADKVVRGALEHELTELLRSLGIPGSASVEIKALEPSNQSNPARPPWMRIRVNGEVCRYPEALLRFGYSYVSGALPAPGIGAPEISAWALGETPERLADFFRFVCREVIASQPVVLLGKPQVDAYIAALPSDEAERIGREPPSAMAVVDALREVLQLRLSIGNLSTVAGTIMDFGGPPEFIAEALISKLACGAIEIHVPASFRTELNKAGAARETELLNYLRDGLYDELGIWVPRIRFVIDPQLRRSCAAFKINHLTTEPVLCLRPDECLVNDTVDRLTLQNVNGRTTTNPASLTPAAVVDVHHSQDLTDKGFTTWDQWEFLILALAAAIRKYAACLVTREVTEARVAQLETAFPALVRTVAEATSLDEITRLLRALASEKVSIRDLRFILETVLDFPFRAPDASRYLILDDRLSADRLGAWLGGVDLLSFVRSGMKRQISHDFARGASTLVVYLLSTELELSIPFAKDKDKIDAVLDSIRAQVIDVDTMTTYILTSQKIRRDLFNITHLELPLVAVISNQDLIPDINLWPVGTIQLQA